MPGLATKADYDRLATETGLRRRRRLLEAHDLPPRRGRGDGRVRGRARLERHGARARPQDGEDPALRDRGDEPAPPGPRAAGRRTRRNRSRPTADESPVPRTRVVFLVLDGLPAEVAGPDGHAGAATRGAATRAPRPRSVPAVLPASTYPNHATFVTGVQPPVHGIVGNHVRGDDGRFRAARQVGPAVPTIFDAAAAAGVTTPRGRRRPGPHRRDGCGRGRWCDLCCLCLRRRHSK